MKTSPSLYLLIQSLAWSAVHAQSSSQVGCFSSSNGLSSIGSATYQSSGYCIPQCAKQGKAVAATTKGSDCWCGDQFPPQSSKTDSSNCNVNCQGFPGEKCGGSSAWTVYLTGSGSSNPGYYGGSSGGSSDSASSAGSASSSTSSADSDSASTKTVSNQATVVTRASTIVVTAAGGQTLIQTAVTTASPQSNNKSGGSSSNTAGIAAGVVVAVVVVGAIAGGIFFLLRHRKQKQEEEKLSQNGAIGSYSNLKPSPSSAGSMSDSRLEPSVMMQRRQSDGSIADNQDYSRRILKVTNPDG